MALLATAPHRERPRTIVAGAAEFSLAESLHGEGVVDIGASLFFLKQGVMTIAAPQALFLVFCVIEHHRRETFGILENDFPRRILGVGPRCASQTDHTCRQERHQTPE